MLRQAAHAQALSCSAAPALFLALSVRLMLLTALLARSRSSVAPRTMFFLLYAGVAVGIGIGTFGLLEFVFGPRHFVGVC